MAPREIRHCLDDMLAAIAGIQKATAHLDFEAFERSWLVKHAVERAIEIISEASRGLPPDVQAARPEIPWPRFVGSATSCATNTITCPRQSSGTL